MQMQYIRVTDFWLRILALRRFAANATSNLSVHHTKRWICSEIDEQYILGALGRFTPEGLRSSAAGQKESSSYTLSSPSSRWNGAEKPGDVLPTDGGRTRPEVKNGAEDQ